MTQEEIKAIAILQTEIEKFAEIIFPHHLYLKTPDFHREIYKLITSDSLRVAIATPRGTSKSTIVSLIFVLHQALFEQAKFIIIISDSYSQSVLFLEAIKSELENNEKLQAIFGNQKSDRWSEGDIELANGVRIMAKGQSMKVRGLKHKEHRPDLVILDDLENQELIANSDRRDKLKRWFYGELMPALDIEKGKIVYIGTILHYASLLNTTIRDNTWDTRLYKVIDNDKLLWPERYPREKIEAIKKEYTQKGVLDEFYCEYMNDPVTSENADFKQEWFKYYEPKDIIDKKLNIFTAVDPAISEADNADYTAIITCGVDDRNNLYILELVRKRLNPPDLISELFRIDSKYKPVKIGIESVAYQKSLIFFTKEEMRRRNHFMNIEEIKVNKDKELRIRRLIGRYQAGTIFHRFYMTDLEDELLRFPKAEHDDCADSLASCQELIYPALKTAPKPKPNTYGALFKIKQSRYNKGIHNWIK